MIASIKQMGVMLEDLAKEKKEPLPNLQAIVFEDNNHAPALNKDIIKGCEDAGFNLSHRFSGKDN